MKRLADTIRRNRSRLAQDYNQRLRAIGDYGRLPEQATLDMAHYDLDLIATCLETGEDAPFIRFVETRMSERVASHLDGESWQQVLTALEETLMPTVSNVDAARFLWHALSQSRALASRIAAERAHTHERDQAQAALRESEERLRLEDAALGAAANAVVITDREGRIVWVNPAFTTLTGYTAKEALNQNPRLLKSGQHSEAFYRGLWNTVLAGQVWRGEMVNRRKDGSLYTEDQTITPVRNERGETTHFIAIKQDITEHRRIEEALRQSEQRYRQIIEESVDVFYTSDPHGRFTFMSPAAEKLTGYAADELIGRHFTELIRADWKERTQSFYLKQFKERVDETLLEFPIATKTGEEKWGEQIVKLLTDGNRVTGFQSIVRDITERKRLEQRLQESELKFREIVNRSLLGIFRTALDGQIVEANPTLLQMVRLESVERANQVGLLNMYVDQVDRQRLLAALREGPVSGFETRFRRGDGEVITISVGAHLVHDEKGQPQFIEGTFEDITDRKRAEGELQAAHQRLLDIIDFLPDAIFVIDQNKQVIAWNRATEEMTGVTKEEMLGRDDYSVPYYGERRPVLIDLLDADDSEIKSRYASVEKKGHTLYTEVFVPRIFGGRGGYLAAMAAPLFDRQGQRIGAIESLRDVTERKHQERQREELYERRATQVQISTQVAQEIAAAPALDELFRRVVTLIKERFDYYHAQILRYEPSQDAVVLVTGYGEAGEQMLAAGHSMPLGRGVVGTAAATGQPILATDIQRDPDWRPNPYLPNTRGELAVPIKLGDQVLGILDVQSERAEALTQDDQLLLEGLCGQIAIAVQDTRLREEMQERLNELSAMYRALSREGWQAMRAQGQLPTGYVFDQGTLQPNPDLWLPEIERAVQENTLVQPDTASSAAVSPLSVRGEVIGALGALGDPRRRLTPDEMGLIEAVSEQVALALESARLFQQTRARSEELAIINEMSRAVSGELKAETVLESIYQHASRLFDTTNFYIALYNAEKDEISFPLAFEDGRRVQWRSRRAGDGLTEYLIRSGEPLLFKENVGQHLQEIGLNMIGREALAWLGVPMRAGERILGAIAVQSYDRPGAFDENDLALLVAIASQSAIAIQNARLFEQVQARVQRESITRAITARVGESLDQGTILKATLRGLCQALGASHAVIRVGLPAQENSPTDKSLQEVDEHTN